jgi:hypothetical protein
MIQLAGQCLNNLAESSGCKRNLNWRNFEHECMFCTAFTVVHHVVYIMNNL